MAANSTVDAVIFNGGYGIEYAEFAAEQAEKMQPGSTFKVTAATKLAQTLQPRFVAGNPPDVIDNSGEGLIAINTIRDQLEDLTSVIDAPNYEGVPIKDTLYEGVTKPGTFDGKFVQLNYVLTVYAIWYSASLFEQEGWAVPKTYEEMLALGAEAKGKNKYLLGWGKEAATYYQTMAISSSIKQGGDEVRLALENLKPDCWSLPADSGRLHRSEEDHRRRVRQAGWRGNPVHGRPVPMEQCARLHPVPVRRLDRERDEEADQEGLPDDRGAGARSSTTDSALPWEALHSTAGEGYIIPTQGKNVAGGKEFMRAMLSKEAAVNFAKTTFSSTIVKDTVPADGFGSTALVSQVKMLEAAGSNIFTWNFIDLYGLNTDHARGLEHLPPRRIERR